MEIETENPKPKKRRKVKRAIKKKVHISKSNAPKNIALENIDLSNNHNQITTPNFISDDEFNDDQNFNNDNYSDDLLYSKKKVIIFAIIAFFVGILFSTVLLNRDKVIRNGLQGVIVNSEIPKGRSRCGLAEKTQGCILYLMNPERQELSAKDFYDLVSKLTGRQRFIIQTGNMRYSNTKIKPGQIGQFNIPPLQ